MFAYFSVRERERERLNRLHTTRLWSGERDAAGEEFGRDEGEGGSFFFLSKKQRCSFPLVFSVFRFFFFFALSGVFPPRPPTPIFYSALPHYAQTLIID